MAPASRSAAAIPVGAAGRAGAPVPRCFSLDQCDRAAPSRPVQPSSPTHPIKELPGHGGLFLAGTRQPPPGPAACPHPAAKISLLHPPPQAPGGAETKPAARQGPEPGTLGMGPQPPGPPARPRGSWKGGGTGRKRGGRGQGQDGCARGTTCSCLRSLQRGGDASRAAAACQVLGPGGNGGRRGSTSSSWDWEGWGEQIHERPAKVPAFTRSGRCQSPLRPPTDPFLGGVKIARDSPCPARLNVPIFPFCSAQKSMRGQQRSLSHVIQVAKTKKHLSCHKPKMSIRPPHQRRS